MVVATEIEQTQAPELDHGENLDVVLMPLETAKEELKKGKFVQAMHVAVMYKSLNHFRLLKRPLTAYFVENSKGKTKRGR